jgi:hypothetical protein
MQRTALAACVALAPSVAFCVTGCNEDPAADNGKGIDEPAPCAACAPALGYAAGPYGWGVGSTIGDATFQGFADAQVEGATLQSLKLSDFYNPNADDPTYKPTTAADDDRLFPPGSIYGAGTKKPRALLIDIGSVWCGPCNGEAKSLLNDKYATYHPCGGGFFYQLAEGVMQGSPMTQQLLGVWSSMYKVPYPITMDNSRALSPFYSSGFPAGVIVDARTMKIVYAIDGVPDDTFWQTYESLLDATCLAGG